ncbi:MAG: hypothetical protein HKN31_11045 [Pricia sp.]|nr:hypothetical protein [Pricia sp.]
MSKIKIKWNSEKLLGLSAMTISFITLIIFIYQTNLISKQNYIFILPYLSISTTDNPADDTFELNLTNNGVGPAIIESVTMIYKDKRYDVADYNYEVYGFLVSKVPELDGIKKVSSATTERGMAIPVNTTFNVFKVMDSLDYQIFSNVFGKLMNEGLNYEVVYRSIQDERWVINGNLSGPKKLD